MDYAALAAQYGGQTEPAPKQPDYAALAAKFGGKTNGPPDINDLPTPLMLGLASPNQAKSMVVGGARGLKDIVDTGAGWLAHGYDKITGGDAPTLSSLVTGQPQGEGARVDAMNKAGAADFERDYGNDNFAKGGRLAGQVAGTLPVGGVVAAPVKLAARAAPFLEPLLGPIASAIESAGFTTGRAAAPAAAPLLTRIGSAVANQGTRAVGGAITGGASTALVEPENTGIGTAIGAALPGTLSVVGKAGRFAGDLFSKGTKSAQDLATALGLDPAALGDIVARLRGAPTLVPNAAPTVAQALQTPEAGIVQRVVHDVPGGMPLRQRLAQQAEARTAALEGVAPTVATGRTDAMNDLGNAVTSRVVPEEQGITRAISGQYAGIDPHGTAQIPLPVAEMQGSVDRYLGAGSFGKNQDAATAVRTAEGLSAPVAVPPTPQILNAQGVPFNPPAAPTPRAATWDEVNKLRNSLGEAWSKASENGETQAAAALAQQRHALDAAIQQHLPPDQLAAWLEANASHAAKMDRFHTGPQAAIFQTRNGEPLVQGGEVAQRFWGARPGAEADVQAFQRLVDNNPAMLGQFKSMVTTEGAGTADAAGNLTAKFSKWFEQHTPGLRAAFSPDEFGALQRIAQDIDRNAAATSAGKTMAGSDTFQKANNALSLGLLDSPALTRAASMVPGVRYAAAPALEGARSLMRNRKAAGLAGLLADSGTAATALEELQRRAAALAGPRKAIDPALQSLFYRSAPIAGSQ